VVFAGGIGDNLPGYHDSERSTGESHRRWSMEIE